MNSQTITLRIAPDELDTILDALRCFQVYGQNDCSEQNDRAEEIDDLCERLNLGE